MPNPLVLQAYKDWKSACLLLEDSLNHYVPFQAKKSYSPKELEFYDSLSFRFIKSLQVLLRIFI